MKRKSKIIKIEEVATYNAARCLRSGVYTVYYSSGVERRFYLQHLTPEMHKFLVRSHDNGNFRVIAVSKADVKGNYVVIKVYYIKGVD